jgi:hypothetical protein
MTDPAVATQVKKSTRESDTPTEPVFVNWESDTFGFANCDLLDGTDFSRYQFVFFDPLQFAKDHGFVKPGTDISEITYVSLEQNEFLRYLGRIKLVAETLRKFLDNNGLLIIRANIPKSHIRVRKRSSTGTMKYTESVISTYFWLKDILGAYSLSFRQARALKYLQPKNPLAHTFGETAVDCIQTLDSVDGSSTKSAAISKITFDSTDGQVFLIPKFLAKGESVKLVEAFALVAVSQASGTIRPHWLDYYEKQINDFSPVRAMMDGIELEMEALKRQLTSAQKKQVKYDSVVDLLFESDRELAIATCAALEILGFECKGLSDDRKACMFEANPIDDKSERFLIRVASNEHGAITSDDVLRLAEAKAARKTTGPFKGLMVGNAFRTGRPEQRPQWFEEDCLEVSRRHGICLLPSLVLFTVVCYIMARNSADNIEALKASLRRDFLHSDSLFVLKREKYAI